MLNLTEISGTSQFFELKSKWNKVLERSREENIYLTWEYLSTYWKHYSKGKNMRILVLSDQNDIIAIAPLRQSRYEFTGPFHYNVLEPLGYRSINQEGADYTGLIIAERDTQCLRSFFNYLVERDDWDFLYLMDVPDSSIDPDLLAGVSKDFSLTFKLDEYEMCPYITIPDSMEIFLNDLNSKFRKNLRRCMKNLQKEHQRIELKNHTEFGSVEEAMGIFFMLHQKRWKIKGMPGVFSTQKVRDFYLDVAKLFEENGWLALYFLTVDDEPIAAQYCFEYQQRMYFALGGFDPDYFQYSVGNLLLVKVVEACIKKGIKEYDLLKGDEPYKFRFTEKYRRNLSIRFVNNRFTSNLYYWAARSIKQTKIDKVLGRFFH